MKDHSELIKHLNTDISRLNTEMTGLLDHLARFQNEAVKRDAQLSALLEFMNAVFRDGLNDTNRSTWNELKRKVTIQDMAMAAKEEE